MADFRESWSAWLEAKPYLRALLVPIAEMAAFTSSLGRCRSPEDIIRACREQELADWIDGDEPEEEDPPCPEPRRGAVECDQFIGNMPFAAAHCRDVAPGWGSGDGRVKYKPQF